MSEPTDSTSVPASPSGNVLLSQLERTNSSQNLPNYHSHGNSNTNTPLVGNNLFFIHHFFNLNVIRIQKIP